MAWRRGGPGWVPTRQIHNERAATADVKTHRGLDHLAVRGLPKVPGSACLVALTYTCSTSEVVVSAARAVEVQWGGSVVSGGFV